MSGITRSESIKQLHRLKADINHGLAFVSKTKDKHLALESLDMAIASLETDEAYDLEYELTKNDLGVDVHDNNVGNIDCISRADAIGIIAVECSAEKLDIDYAKFLMLRRAIKALPTVTPQEPRWIPVNERLPEDSGEYLVSVIDEYNENQHYYKAVEVAWFAHKKDYDIKESEWRELGIDEKVIAWMPLPKAYKEVEE